MFGSTLSPTSPGSGGDGLTQRAIARAKAGDPEGIHYLYVRFGEDIIGHALSFVRGRRDAEGIMRSVFANLPTTIRTYDDRELSFDAWLTRTAGDAALDHLRARRTAPGEGLELPEGQGEVLFYED
jgi:DNA-directed RNA polymerase specialized sigma24 family protein